MSNVPTNLIPTRITGLPEYVGSSTLGYIPYVLEGRTYKVQFANIAAVGAVPSTRVIGTGNGLEGGGDLSQNRVISIIPHGVGYSQLDFTGVTAGTYGSADTIPSLTIDATGRVTAAVNTPVVLSNYVPTSRTVTAGAGLTGGGQLNNNITIALNPSNATPQPLGAASPGTGTQAARDDHVHPAVDLTDTSETQGVLPLGRGGTGVALSPVVGAVIYADNDSLNQTTAGNAGQILKSAGGLGAPYWDDLAAGGTVTSVSVVSANGFAGTVANPSTTPAITLTTTISGLVKGDGTAISAAIAGTDYVAPGAITTSGLTMATSRLLGRTTASTGAVEEITVGTGLTLSGGSLVNSAPDQTVTLTGGTAISISGSYPSFTITNTAPDQIVSLTGAGTTVVTGTYPNFTITSNDAYTGTVTSVAASGGTTGLTFSGSPITTSGTLTLGGTLVVANGGTGATTAAGARTNLGAAASGANSDITSLSGLTGGIATPDYIDFDTTATVTRATGRLWWDNTDGIQTLNLGMAGSNATMQIGEELYFRVKASSAITEGQVVMFTGTVGASGALTAAPATGLTKDTASYIMGVATEDIALNGWGYVTQFGLVRGIDTTGGAEAWVDGQILYYNPSVAGGLTKTVPTAPAAKVEVAAVVNAASGGSGSLFVRPTARFSLGQLNDVETAAAANLDLLQYNSSGGYWQHVAPSTISVGTATNLSGGAANQIAYQTGAGATSFITAPTVANTFLEWSGSAFQWSSNPLGTVTSVAMTVPTGLTVSGSPITTSGTLAVSLQSGYSIPTTASQANWDTAYSERLQWDGGSTNLVAATGRTSLGATTVGSNFFTLSNPSAITFPRINADNTVSALSASDFRTAIGAGTGSGSVTSVDVSGGTTGLTFSGGPVTTSGTITMAGTLAVGNGGTGTSTAFTAGSIVFAGTSGVYSQDNANLFWDDTNNRLGIGTASPGYQLDISSTDTTVGLGYAFRIRANATAGGGTIQFTDSGATAQWGFLASTATATTLDCSGAGSVVFRTNNSERARISSSGYFGVGTSSPQVGVHVSFADQSTNRVRLQNTGSGGGNFDIVGGNPGASNAGLAFYDVTNTATRMYINSSGNLLVGTTTDKNRLTVTAGANTNSPTLGSAGGIAYFTNTDVAYGLNVGTNASDGHVWLQAQRTDGTATAYNITLNEAGGNVGIGTSSPGTRLDVSDVSRYTFSVSNAYTLQTSLNAAGSAFANAYINALAHIWQTSGTERMRLGANGGLAIGGTGTDASLHIQQSYGGYDRLTQISPGSASKNAFNIMAARNGSNADIWWTWGVTTGNEWTFQPGVNSAMNSSTGIYFTSSAGANKPGGGTWGATSDQRIKTNITPITDAASRIMALKPSSFDYRAPEAHAGRVSDRGFIAQEFEQVYPHGVSESLNICDEEKPFFGEGEKLKSVGLNNDFFADLVALVQEQQAIITDLRARVAQLEGK